MVRQCHKDDLGAMMISMRWLLLSLLLSSPAAMAQSRLQAQVPGHAEGVQGVGERRYLPDRFQHSNNPAAGRRFEQSFDLRTNAQFSAHNIDNVSERLVGESLYNNPWYWQNVGSLDTELMTGGSGLAVATPGIDGGYYNPFFYSQWQTTDGLRHSGRMSATGVQAQRNDLESNLPWDRRAPVPGNAVTTPDTDLTGTGILNASRISAEPATGLQSGRVTAGGNRLSDQRKVAVDSNQLVSGSLLQGHRLSSVLRADVDDYSDGHVERELGRGMSRNSGGIRYMGSSMRGLSTTSAGLGVYDHGLTSFDLARLRDDQMAGRPMMTPGLVWDTRFRDLELRPQVIGQDTRLEPGSTSGASGEGAPPTPSLSTIPGLQSTYKAMAERYRSFHPSTMTASDQLAALDRDYRRLRGDLIAGDRVSPSDLRVLPGESEQPDVPANVVTDTTASETPDTPDMTPLDSAPQLLAWDDYGLLLRHGQQVTSYAANDGTRFDDLVLAAQQALMDGDYFLAERRFNRALRFVHGQPLATAGEGHAQLGAGLYLSAALTLQSLLGFQPEMIDVIYDRRLLPAQADLDRAISDLTGRLSFEADVDRYGFLLAYIGHQLDRKDLITQGLDAMRRGGADASFVSILEEVWLKSTAIPEEPDTLREVQPAG